LIEQAVKFVITDGFDSGPLYTSRIACQNLATFEPGRAIYNYPSNMYFAVNAEGL
jgi:hypothetical protein